MCSVLVYLINSGEKNKLGEGVSGGTGVGSSGEVRDSIVGRVNQWPQADVFPGQEEQA